MNYHILIDEKFIDDFIIDAESVSNQNIYIYLFNKPSKVIKSNLGIFAPLGSNSLKEITEKIKPEDKVFIHWFHIGINNLVDQLPPQTEVYLMFWGGDFIGLPHNCGYNNKIASFLYEPKSFNYLKSLAVKEKKTHIKSLIKVALRSKNPFQISKLFIKIPDSYLFYFSRNYKSIITARTKFLKRLTAICHWNRLDVDILESLYGVKLNMRPFSYGVGIDQLNDVKRLKIKERKEMTFFLGNSDTLTNNHLDAFDILMQFKDDNIKIYCPLNYERKKYAEYISKKGTEIFGNKFIPLLDFLPRSEYYKLMDNIDICLMYHIRTQAGGNILAFLKKGIKVYLNNKSSIYRLYKHLDFPVFDAEKISFDAIYFKNPIFNEKQRRDIDLWENSVKRQKDLKELLN